jgi:hypothetical protein
MAGSTDDIDELYRVPLTEFTAARNALAKRLGPGGADVKTLSKPPVAAWAINQVYWRRRDVYDAMIEAAREARAAHQATLAGKKADVRAASKAHEQAMDAVLKAALEILKSDGQPATEATRQAIATTLRALPSPDSPGRLSRTLQPGGLEMLTGMPVREAPRGGTVVKGPGPASAKTAAGKAAPAAGPRKADVDPRALAKARERVSEAARAARIAEHAASRDEFDAARAARAAEQADRAVAAAREALEAAQRRLEEAEEEAAAAGRARREAERKAQKSAEALDAARERLDEAERAVQELKG